MPPRVRQWWSTRLVVVLLVATATPLASAQHGVPDDRRVLLEAIESREWILRAVAAMRLERADATHADLLLERLARDRDWRVRAFAIRTIARRPGGVAQLETLDETDPRVLRVAMLYGARPDSERIGRRSALEMRSRTLARKITGIEIAAMLGRAEDLERVAATLERLGRTLTPREAGELSARLSGACGLPPQASADTWKAWIERTTIEPGTITPRPMTVPPAGETDNDAGTGASSDGDTESGEGADVDADADDDYDAAAARIADMPAGQFVRFMEDYLGDLKARPVELVIVLDRTGSMRYTLEAAKAGSAGLIRFIGDLASRFRVGLVTYAGLLSELQSLGLTDRSEDMQTFLYETTIGKGSNETVLAALQAAIEHNRFNHRALKVVVLIGDEPFQKTNESAVRTLVERAAADGIVVSTVHARRPTEGAPTELPAWDRIAEWGGGRAVALDDPDDLIELIIALTIGGGWQPQVSDLLGAYKECVP